MALTITPGYLFGDREQVTPAKLNQLVDDATITGLTVSNIAGNTTGVLFYGSTAPPLARGILWYDTTAGSEGLKYAWVSASYASVSKWLYLTPRRDMMCWTSSGCSFGEPLFIGNRQDRDNYNARLTEWTRFDGVIFPRAWKYGGASGANPLMVVALENAAPNTPVQCAWAGFVSQAVMGNNPIAAGENVSTDYTSPTTFKSNAPAARHHIWGLNTKNSSQAGARGDLILPGTPCAEDMTP